MKYIVLFFICVFSIPALAQVSVVNADSVRLGNPVGSGGVSLHGKTYLKNISAGSLSDSVLVRDGSGQIRFVKRSTFANFQDASSSVKGMIKLAGDLGGTADFPLVIGKQAQLNGTGFVKANGTTISYDNSTYLTAGSAASIYQPLEDQRLSRSNNVIFQQVTAAGTDATYRGFQINSGSNPRWFFSAQPSSAATLNLFRYNDDGSYAGSVFDVNRSNGILNFTSAPTVAGTSLVYNTGTWGINITGNAATATNSTQWNGYGFDASNFGNSLGYLTGKDNTSGKIMPFNSAQVQSWLGLGSAVYLNADVNATANSVVQRNPSGQIFASYIRASANKTAPENGTPTALIGHYAGSDDYYYDFSASAINAFLGIPSGGDNLQSVTDRGGSTNNLIRSSNFIDITPSSAFRNYDGTNFTGGIGGAAWAFGGSYVNTDYAVYATNHFRIGAGGLERFNIVSNGNTQIGYANDQGYKLAVNGTGLFNGEVNGAAFNAVKSSGLFASFQKTSNVDGNAWINWRNNAGGEIAWIGYGGSDNTFGITNGLGEIKLNTSLVRTSNALYVGSTATFNGDVGIGDSPRSGGGNAKWLTLGGIGSDYSGGNIYTVNGVVKGYTYSQAGYLISQSVVGEGFKVTVNNTSDALVIASNNNATFTGSVTASGGFFNSDIRLKNLTSYPYNSTAISDLKPITYKWKDKRDDKKHIGYSAQEVEKVLPDAISTDDKGIKSVNYIEVLVAKIEALEKRIKELEAKEGKK